MKKALKVLAAAALLAAANVPAFAIENYRGPSSYRSSTDWRTQEFRLGDSTDNTYLFLTGTQRYCGVPGDSYIELEWVIDNDDDGVISWAILNECSDSFGEFVRVRIRNHRGETAISTFHTHDWYRW